MDEQNNGTIKIAEDVIATIAVTAALEIEGVAKVHQKIMSNAKNIVGNIKPSAKNVNIVTTDAGLELTAQITVKNGYKIPDVASAVQTSIKDAVTNMTGLEVAKVNIIVSNVVDEKAK